MNEWMNEWVPNSPGCKNRTKLDCYLTSHNAEVLRRLRSFTIGYRIADNSTTKRTRQSNQLDFGGDDLDPQFMIMIRQIVRTYPLSLDRFSPNFSQTRVLQVVARDIWFHIPEKFPLRDRICRKTLFLGYPICDQPTGRGKRSATPTLFPSPSGHPTDVPFLGDFCWGMHRFPAIHLRMCPYQQMAITGWGHSSATWREAGHYTQ